VPEHLPEFGRVRLLAATAAGAPPATALDALLACGFASSRSAARRLVQQGAVEIAGRRVADFFEEVDPDGEWVIRAGRRMARYRPGA
jgi:tyrosyl-tRNA synthetase